MTDIMLDDHEPTEDIDISELTSIDEQKECCKKMLDGIIYEEDRLSKRMMSVQTINHAIQSDEKLVNSLGEYLGYHYGRMSASKNIIDNALINLGCFLEGDMDEVDHGARGMYLSLWYNIGISGIDEVEECLHDLEKMENDIVETAFKNGDNSIFDKETLH